MKKSEKFKLGKCSAPIWKKFTKEKKAYWQLFYDAFWLKEALPTGVEFTDDQMNVLAHNMACQAVWAMLKVEKAG